jgi:hypothetical protein
MSSFIEEEDVKTQISRWLVLLVSPVVWTLSFSLLYLIDEAVCGLSMWRWYVWGRVTAVIPLMLFVLLITFGVTLANAFWGWRMWQSGQNSAAETAERDRFIGLSGLLLGGLFSFLTLALVTAVLVLEPC